MAIATGPNIAEPKTDPSEVLAQAKDLGVKIVDFKFIDLPGLWQHFSIPVEDFVADLFTEGIGFDGSSIRGFQKINESDMLLLPDIGRASCRETASGWMISASSSRSRSCAR